MSEMDSRYFRFHGYEADLAAGELRRNGKRLSLQEQPFLILAALLEKPGEIVTREDLRDRLWPGRTFVDFDQGLNTAVNKLRDALGDSAANPRFVETVPRRGYRFVSDVQTGLETGSSAESPDQEAVQDRRFQRRHVILIAAATVGLGGIGSRFWVRTPSIKPRPALRRFALPMPLTAVGATGCTRTAAISPDGSRIAFTEGGGANLRLWIQELDREQPRPVEGAEGAQFPFWSPDSKHVGFTILSNRTLMRIGVEGGIPRRICNLPAAGFDSGAAWNPNGETIIFATFGTGGHSVMHEVPASGGTSALVVSRDFVKQIRAVPEARLQYLHAPHFLPLENGRRVILFGAGWTDPLVLLADLDTGRTEVLGSGRLPAYSRSGHLIFQSSGDTEDLWAQPFSLRELKTTAPPFPVARNGTEPTVAEDGTLVYIDPASEQLVWLDRRGESLGETGPAGLGVFYPAISPDGRRIAAEVKVGQNFDVWVHHLAMGARTRLSIDPALDILPVWSPDGERVAYSSWRAGNTDIYVRRADAGAEEESLPATPASERVSDWSSDGKYILYSRIDAKGGCELWYLLRGGPGKWEQVPFMQTRFRTSVAKFSPDSRYVAYLSDESGRDELYVRPFPKGDRQWTISRNGAAQPRWARHGRELFYVESAKLMAVPVQAGSGFSAGAPIPLFAHAGLAPWRDPNYDVSADGQRFLIPELGGGQGQRRLIHVVQNWFAEFQDRR